MDAAAGLIVMGGPMAVYERDRYPFLGEELRLIAQALKADKPVLGVCLGSQLLATVLGATVAPAPQKEIGWYPVTLTEHGPTDRLLADVEPSFVAFHWHGDIFTLPEGATPLAASRVTAHQAYRYGRTAYGFLFHMEVTEDIVMGMLDHFADERAAAGVREERIIDGVEEYLPRLESIAEMVFGRWAALVE
jgi:GMP synthase (glutamine-hydrolysing)